MAHNRFQTANNHTGANGGRVSNAPTDQRRWTASSSAIGAAKTRPSRSTRSRQTGAGMIFESVSKTTTSAPLCPWQVGAKKEENGTYLLTINEGKIIDQLAGFDELDVTIGENVEVEINDVVHFTITYPTDANPDLFIYEVEATNKDSFEKYDLSTVTPPDIPLVVKSRVPIALLEAPDNTNSNTPVVNQFIKNNLIQSNIVIDGKLIKYFFAI